MKYIRNFLPMSIAIVMISSCGVWNAKDNETDKSTFIANNTDEVARIRTITLKTDNFDKEVISNGKLKAFQTADLFFKNNSNIITTIMVKNGERIRKGQLIAKLDDFILQNAYTQVQNQFKRSCLDLQDVLIAQGFDPQDTVNIPENVMRTARVKSGYDRSFSEQEKAAYDLMMAELRAPFDGIVANLFSKENNMPPTDKFCTIINDESFEAEFPLLEGELEWVKQGQQVTILPYPLPGLKVEGQVSQINPVIGQDGMVKIKALCSNSCHKLFEGMNVKIIIANKEPGKLSIPKEALVLRNEKQVVFTYSNGLAKWNYVRTGLENSTGYTIEEGLTEGDTVIVEGGMNLAHGSKVFLVKE